MESTYRLWRISWRIRQNQGMPDEFYQDLVDMQRSDRDIYTNVERCKAWSLLRTLVHKQHEHEVADALLKFPPHVIITFLRSLGMHDDTLVFTPHATLISLIQLERPWIFDELTLDSFCAIVSQTRHPDSTQRLTLYSFFDTIAKTSQQMSQHDHSGCFAQPSPRTVSSLVVRFPYTMDKCVHNPGIHNHHSCWDLPGFAQCLMMFLVTAGREDIRRVVEHILLSLTPFAKEFPSSKDTQHVIQYHPHLLKGALHPIRPFILFAIHLVYSSEVAARLFIKNGILIILGRLWVHDFRDPRGAGWRTEPALNDMRVGCLLLLGGLARHYPAAREMADHLLQQLVAKDAKQKVQTMLLLGGCENMCHYKGLSNIACASCPTLLCAIPSLTLCFMETCLTQCVRIPEAAHIYGEPWVEVMNILASPRTKEKYLRVKDAAARTLFALASIPEEHWQGFSESLSTQTLKRCDAAFKFITHNFLLATRDPSAMSQQNLDALRKMHAGAVSRESEIVNPVDRFILLIRVRQATHGTQFSNILTRSGFRDLLTAVQKGRVSMTGWPSLATDPAE
ncbi:hypothetical protein EUX98_g7735 [Antrodiella citrinella]|uniref:Uncharacterized protein n=1 Tax=Antrodiella citrinella TaxID=2447956 RepID=A0A4S4MMM8_9APHY|nr:hypothetical protein EUX98_g7735 [Antrodiella citrinella]